MSDRSVGKYELQVGKKGSQVGKIAVQVGKITAQVGIEICLVPERKRDDSFISQNKTLPILNRCHQQKRLLASQKQYSRF